MKAYEGELVSLSEITNGLRQKIKIIVKDETNSTNDDAKSEFLKSGENTVVVAREQKRGRGRLNRKFFSDKDCGIFMSLAIRPEKKLKEISAYTTYTAVVVANAVEKFCNVDAKIKWVNDIYVNNKKICGILCESLYNPEMEKIEGVVIGIGINVNNLSFPDEIKNKATSLLLESGVNVSKNRLCSEIINEFFKLKIDYIEEYRRRSLVLGKEITVYTLESSFKAKAKRIEDDASLTVEKEGKEINLNAGEVSLKLD